MDFRLNLIKTIFSLLSFVQLISCESTNFENFTNCLLVSNFSNISPEQIIVENSSRYEYANYQWQLHGGLLFPAGYLLPNKSSDIQAAVKCGRVHNVTVIAKSGGHSYGKFSFGSTINTTLNSRTLILDLQNLNEVKIKRDDPNLADVGTGSLTGHMAWKLYTSGKKLLPIGICPTVGIGGLALGGGHGYMSRTYGLMMDNIVEYEFIDYKGDLLVVNNKNYSDLFWALKGAGGGNLGIVSKFTFKIYPVPSTVMYLVNVYELAQFPEVFISWQTFVQDNPWNSISTALHVKDNSVILEFVAFLQDGGSVGGGVQDGRYSSVLTTDYVLRLFNFSFPTFTITNQSTIEFLDYPGFLLKMAHQFGMIITPPIHQMSDILNTTHHSFGQSYMRAKSFYGKRVVNGTEELRQLTEIVAQTPKTAVLYFLSYGGLINSILPNETSFIHRGPNILYHCEIVQYGNLDDEQAGFPWIEQFFNVSLDVIKHDESYQNYIDDELIDYTTRYYGSNLEALIEVKNKYDPINYFTTAMPIPTSGGGSTEKPVASSMTSTSGGSMSNYVSIFIILALAYLI